MTFAALDLNVFSLQRIPGSIVLLHAKERRLPAFHGMALRAFTLFRAPFELAFVRVGLMTIRAVLERQRLLEITVDMALGATDGRVLPKKRIFRFRMVELKFG